VDLDGPTIGRLLLAVGLLLAAGGLVLALGGRLPFGRLPGDLSGGRGSFSWSLPLATSIVLSIVLTIVINVVIRR